MSDNSAVDLTDDETIVLKALVDAWNNFAVRLPDEHPDDTDEFRHHIRALQMMIIARRRLNQRTAD